MKKNSTVTNSKTSRLNKSESEKNQKKTKSEPKLFDLIKESSDFLGKINFSNETFGRLGDEELGRIENAVSKIPSLNNVKIKTKGEGVQDGFIIEKENKDKVFIKKDLVNSLSEVMLASNILYNMGLGPKVGFEKQGDGFVQFSKDLQFSEKSQDRKFHEAMTEMEQKYPVQNMQMYKIAKILKISDVSNESNTGIVKKKWCCQG